MGMTAYAYPAGGMPVECSLALLAIVAGLPAIALFVWLVTREAAD